jgi:hypothetical protein
MLCSRFISQTHLGWLIQADFNGITISCLQIVNLVAYIKYNVI